MATAEQAIESQEQPLNKGLKSGALGLISSTVIATASVAPAYSIAATLVFVVLAVGLQSPAVAVLAFIPMLLTSIGYSELNKADPDCGTTFTWATRAFGPKTGWAGGWAIVAADVLVMASLAQVAGQYVFLLFNVGSIGSNPTAWQVLLAGIIWIILMTIICYVGIEVSANFQKILLGIELTMLLVLSVVALVKVGSGTAPPGHLTPSISWLNPFKISSFSAFASGIILMVFIYWGWDTAVSVNEETRDRNRTPGLAAIFSTIILLVTYGLVIFSMQAFAGVKTTGNGLGNVNNAGDVLSVQGSAIFGTTGFGPVFYHLLLLMVLSSAAASTQTTILPTARTTLSMAAYKALPKSFSRIHPRFLTPTVSTVLMGVISIVIYAGLNSTSNGSGVIGDAVLAIGLYIAFYYGLTGFACAWYYRKNLTSSARNLFMQGILPVTGALILWFLGGWSLWLNYDVATANDYTMWTVPFIHWQIGGAFVIAVAAALVGVVFFLFCRYVRPGAPFFRKQTLTRATPTLVPDK
ncbi:MAG TPA: APC family permease [Streptosporangiaceae bacterium]|jgi:amino acid transporter|nr:APC family permease [Streptosporangiaceae bacterium]